MRGSDGAAVGVPEAWQLPDWILVVMRHLPTWADRTNFMVVEPKLRYSESTWREFCYMLADETGLYVAPGRLQCPHPSHTWRSLFHDLWRARRRWDEAEASEVPEGARQTRDETDVGAPADHQWGELLAEQQRRRAEEKVKEGANLRYSITAGVRFRPLDPLVDPGSEEVRKMRLPLHQRVSVLKMQGERALGKPVSTREALKMLSLNNGEDPWANASVRTAKRSEAVISPEAEAARTPVALSPLEDDDYVVGVRRINAADASVTTCIPGIGMREFRFDRVYEGATGQEAVYDTFGRSAVMDLLNSFSASVIVYGQTGSGKTHTCFGPSKPIIKGGGTDLESIDRGLVPRMGEEIFSAIAARNARGTGIHHELSMSYVEIFGEEIMDLLNEGLAVGQSKVSGQRYVLDGDCEVPVTSLADMRRLLEKGDALKRRAATAMNERSSRAHAIVIFNLRQTKGEGAPAVQSKLMVADLGGSENLSQSKAADSVKGAGTVTWKEYYENRGRVGEAININLGLFQLKCCIEKLNERSADPEADVHVPYTKSKLTMILSSALGGSSKTAMLCTASLAGSHAVQSIQTLRFAESCRDLKNDITRVDPALLAVLERLDKEVDELRAEIKSLEKWETRTEERIDAYSGDVEKVVTSALVGAERENELLKELLVRRQLIAATA